jgi:hypothetical protein
MNTDFVQVPAALFWKFLTGAFGLFGLMIAKIVHQHFAERATKNVLKDAAEKVPELVRTTAEDRGVESMLPQGRPRKRLNTFQAVDVLTNALRESDHLSNTRVRAVNLPSEHPFARSPSSDENPTNPVPGVQRARMRQSTPGTHTEVPHLGFEEDRETPTDPSAVEPKR